MFVLSVMVRFIVGIVNVCVVMWGLFFLIMNDSWWSVGVRCGVGG